jgi:hypothetical protein
MIGLLGIVVGLLGAEGPFGDTWVIPLAVEVLPVNGETAGELPIALGHGKVFGTTPPIGVTS